MRRFNPSSPWPERAVQAWQILTGAAMLRRSLTYEDLSVLMYRREAAGVIQQILAHVAYYCRQEGLPILTVIVVGKDRGAPGLEIPVPSGDFDSERERVFREDWFDIYPPTADEFAAAYASFQARG